MSRSVVLAGALLCASPALANERPATERVTDALGFSLIGTLGGFVGAGLGLFAADGCTTSDSHDGDECIGTAVLGAGLGAAAGFLFGGVIFDGVSDGDGSLRAALGGAGIGVAAGLLTGGEEGLAVVMPLGVVIGSSLGYAIFDAVEDAAPGIVVLPDGRGGTRSTLGLTGRF